MGRGRAKAKQTRVARELKYHSPNTDLAALQRELAGSRGSEPVDDVYEEYADADDETDDPDGDAGDGDADTGDWATRGR
jgi:hypothetical protein